MKMAFKVMKWEIMRKIRSKQFIIGIIITPLIMLLFAGAPTLLERLSGTENGVYVVSDQLKEIEKMHELSKEQDIDFLETNLVLKEKEDIEKILQAEEADGYFIFDENVVSSGVVKVFTLDQKLTSRVELQNIISNIVQNNRIAEEKIEMEKLNYLTARTEVLPEVVLTAGEDKETDIQKGIGGAQDVILSISIVVLLFVLIYSSASELLMSAVQEKKDKMAEIILSSLDSTSLMAGKIIGHLILSIITLLVWGGVGLPLAKYFFDIQVLEYLLSPIFPLMMLFALLGFFLFAALFVSIGSTVEDIQSINNLHSIIMMLPFLPLIFFAPVFSQPGGIVARIASIFPLTSPLIMIARLGMTRVPLWEVILSIIILLLTVFLLIKLAAKIFRVGMLMYGKTATPAEIWKWLKY